MKRMKFLAIAVVLATIMIVAAPQPVYADYTFTNCVTYLWETFCSEVTVHDPTGDGLFQAMYAFCQMVGLCP